MLSLTKILIGEPRTARYFVHNLSPVIYSKYTVILDPSSPAPFALDDTFSVLNIFLWTTF